MGAFDGLVNFVASSEVVAGDDEVFQFVGGAGNLSGATMIFCTSTPLRHKP